MDLYGQITVLPAKTKILHMRTFVLCRVPLDLQSSVIAKLRLPPGGDIFEFALIHRRNRFLMTVLPGTFCYDPGVDVDTDQQCLAELLEPIPRKDVRIVHHRRPMCRVNGQGTTIFFRVELLEILAERHPENPLLATMAKILREVEATPDVFLPKRDKFVPFSKRSRISGRYARGLDFSAKEDAVLAMYFGADDDGRRHALTPEAWTQLLEVGLRGRRTRRGVLARIGVINGQLKRSLMKDGFLDAEGLRKYMAGKLGQRTRVPTYRPRPDGSYYPPAGPMRDRKRRRGSANVVEEKEDLRDDDQACE